MSDLTSLFDALYTRLLLRDFFGKIVPGSFIILAIVISLPPIPTSILETVKCFGAMSFWLWLFFLGWHGLLRSPFKRLERHSNSLNGMVKKLTGNSLKNELISADAPVVENLNS